MPQSHRLFIGNIPKGTSEEELSAEFGSYGLVESIEIKTKPNPLNDSLDTFGFITLNTPENILHICIKEFQGQKYKGVYLNVSRAKESFLDRLKREREEAKSQKQCAVSLDPYRKPTQDENVVESAKPLPALPTLPTLSKQDESSSSESSESESDEKEESPSTSKTGGSLGRVAGKAQNSEPQDDIVRKWNQETYIEHGKLKIIPITGQVKEVIDRSKPHRNRSEGRNLGEQARIADEKRKQGLTKLKSAYDQQKNAIKSALSGDSVNNKRKITFSDDEDDPSLSKPKLSLFDDHDNEDGFEGNFAIRNRLVGAEGQKLHEMQTAYQADNRFRLDSRFLDGEDKGKTKPKAFDKKNEKERRKQLEILSNVTGKVITGEKRDDSKKAPKMQRFDPTKQTDRSNRNQQSENQAELFEMEKIDKREEEFKVSEQKFYHVSDNMFSVMKESGKNFSLLSMFGGSVDQDRPDEKVENTAENGVHEEKPFHTDAKFKYDSSESEEEQQDVDDRQDEWHMGDSSRGGNVVEGKYDKKGSQKVEQRKSGGYYSKQGIWKETFFFLFDDIRFEDGRKFFSMNSTPIGESAATKEANEDGNNKKNGLHDIYRIFKKRRNREGRLIRMKSKIGFKTVKKQTLKR